MGKIRHVCFINFENLYLLLLYPLFSQEKLSFSRETWSRGQQKLQTVSYLFRYWAGAFIKSRSPQSSEGKKVAEIKLLITGIMLTFITFIGLFSNT